MAVTRGRQRWSLTDLHKSLRKNDEASASMVTFIVGTSAFFISTAVLLQFVAEPPGGTSSLEHADLKSKASGALSVLLSTPGYPASWVDTSEGVDGLNRLGLVDAGASIRIAPQKFEALANGSYTTPSASNGRVDYAEAVNALGLQGYNFHLRAYPLIEPFYAGTYGVEGMEEFKVAYIGDYTGVTQEPSSLAERTQLDALPIDFDNTRRLSLIGTGDVYRDDKNDLSNFLVPQLGAAPIQTVISAGSGTPKFDFMIVPPSTYQTQVPLSVASKAIALSETGANLGYTKNRELRTVLGLANMSTLTVSGQFSWKEWVNTGGDPDDYGYLEVSPNNGTTWYPLTNSPTERSNPGAYPFIPSTMNARTATLSAANCASCLGKNEVWVAFHWLADNDATTGSGWIVDDVELLIAGTTVFSQSFESPAYDLLVIGSNVDQNALTSAEVKNAIRDYVQLYEGRLLVLGGQSNTNWLQPLFHVGVRETSPGVASPDSTHPLLTIPNELDWQAYNHNNKAWDFSQQGAQDLFNMVVGAGTTDHVLSVSTKGAFGNTGADGVVMLTTYLPHSMSSEEAKRFFANVLTYGRYHRLYMEVGPEVPTTVPVASASRSALMDKTTIGAGNYIEMGFILYVWAGQSSATILPATLVPTPPQSVLATASPGAVTLSWSPPLNTGTSAVSNYRIYRGGLSGTETFLANTGANNTSFIDYAVTNGFTYYYNITAENAQGTSGSSPHVSATPATVPGVPTTFSANSLLGSVLLSWNPPASSGGATVTHYNVYRSADNVTFTFLTTVASNSYSDLAGGSSYYRVTASNTQGEGPNTIGLPGTAGSTPTAPLALNATALIGKQVVLVWLPPASDGGSAITSYEVWRSTVSGSEVFLVNAGNTLTYTNTGLTAGTTYYYQVRAINAFGASALSAERSATALI